MSDVVIVAIITGLCSVIGQWLISHSTNVKRREDEAVRDARLDDRLASVESKLIVHNGYAARFEEIQVDIAQIKKDIEYIGQR